MTAQLELFPRSAVISLPPCGRGLGRCEAIVEPDQIRCLTCGCVAPRASQNDVPKGTIFDGFIQSQLKFLRSRDGAGPMPACSRSAEK
jgi:hypothetical protein